ncbi:hypothetical protein P3X83_31075 [Spongiactinospora sp. TRM90649]|nr:hypothetical protein [Spongiactinospora sp. TRM90649]
MCTGVLPASGSDAYTTARGRLIVSNGYCEGGCAERQATAVAQQHQQQVPHTLPGRPQPPMPQPVQPMQSMGQMHSMQQMQPPMPAAPQETRQPVGAQPLAAPHYPAPPQHPQPQHPQVTYPSRVPS